MLARPLVGVQTGDAKAKVEQHVHLPAVFNVPIRPDLVQDVFVRMNKNRRQAYAVSMYAGHGYSAESWGTGRAVARIPRVSGGGTHRAGQGAFGNMCRGGRRFSPTKTWRRWHRRINHTQRRYAVASALAASAIPALVTARGHRIQQTPEIPLVIDNKTIDNIDKTKKAIALFKSIHAMEDVDRVRETRKIRVGKGKMRNRRHTQRRGPLVIYNERSPLTKAFRNLPGVELCNVNKLSLLQLAPGGHLGRFIVWTKDAFQRLDALFGSHKKVSTVKKNYQIPRNIVTSADLSRVINSDEIQSVLPEKKKPVHVERKINPLRSSRAMAKLNPAESIKTRRNIVQRLQQEAKRAALLVEKRTGKKAPVDAKTKAREAAHEARVKKQVATRKAQQKRIRGQRTAFRKALLKK